MTTKSHQPEFAAMMREFYKDPENERKFQEWKRSRKRGCASQPASERRAPQRFTSEPRPV